MHQEVLTLLEQVYEKARQAKANTYPRKDSSGRLLSESFCIPFIIFRMGALCDEGYEFLRLCKNGNGGAILHLLNALVTQDAKWTATRVCRGLFGSLL